MKKSYYIVIIIVIIFGAWLLFKTFSHRPEYAEFTNTRPVKGNLESSIVIVEWSDFECPACGSAYPFIKEVFEKYQDKVKFEYRHFPLSYHRYAYDAAVAGECAHDQGKFWEFHDKLFENQKNLTAKDLKNYAVEVGLDQELFSDCLASDVKEKVVNKDIADGQRLDLRFTPSIFVNGQLVENWQNLEDVILSLIKPVMAAEEKLNSTSTSGE